MKVNPITLKEPFQFLSKHTYFGTVLTKLIGRTGFRRYLFKNGFEGPNSANSIDLELGNTNLYLNRAMQSVLRINKIAKERKAKLVVLLMAQNFYFGDDNPHANKELINKLNQVRNENNLLRQLNVFCKNNSLICLDPTLVLAREDFFPVDAHWNVNGHRKVGVFLSEQLFK